MAGNMIFFGIPLLLCVIGTNGLGEFSVLHNPDSLKFSGSEDVLESLLKEIFSASLGLSVEENSDWNGLSIVDPFNTPEAVVEVYIDGISKLGDVAGLKAKTYPLEVDEYEPDTFDAVRHRINQRFSNGGNKLVNIELSQPEQVTSHANIFGIVSIPKVTKQSLIHLKKSVEEDYEFLSELENLKAITAKVSSGAISADNVIDYYNFRFSSLHALSDLHGPNSLQTKEAKKLLGEALEKLNAAFKTAYDGSVLVTVVCTDVAHTRRAVRQAPAQEEVKTEAVDNNFSAIFNIILWFVVVLAFTMIAIVYAIMDMDPGRDSIIYRMTSTRMKKDN